MLGNCMMHEVNAAITPGSNPSPTRRQSPCSESMGDVASEREVRGIEAMGYVMVNANNQRCQNCRKDRQKCIRTYPNQVKCDRCIKSGYTCTIDDVNAPIDGKRRKLQRLKCEACRSAKVKCDPVDRAWPEKCVRCKKIGLACSEPQMSNNKKKMQADGRTVTTPRSAEDESDDSDDGDQPIPIRYKRQAVPRTPARISTEEPTNSVQPIQSIRPIRTPRRSLSDIVDDVLPPPKPDYIYAPLKDDEIRLLVVHPGSYGQEIMCFLITERLHGCRPYQALSYRWGEDAPNKPINIISYKSASKSKSFRDFKIPKLYTRSNLFEALQQLRQPTDQIRLYVNALCIDHDNTDEEHAQASRTQEIFNQASDVIVWLGTETFTTRTAFEFIPRVLDVNDFDKLVKEESNNHCWDALVELMRNSLFSRRWLIQELAVARTAALQCGPHFIQWTDFADAVALFEANLPEIQRYSKFSLASGGPINDIRALGASTLVSVLNNIIRKTSDGKVLNRLESMETLISLLAVFEATKPLDTIVSVIGLAKDGAQVQTRIDNGREIGDNYINFVAYCVDSSHSIDIICQHWAPVIREKIPNYIQRNRGLRPNKTQLPSWIPNISGSAFGAPEDKNKDKQSGRVHGDSFVGLPSHKIYNACKGFPAAAPKFGVVTLPNEIQQPNVQYDGTLTTQGLILARIANLSPPAASGIIFQECLEMGGWQSDSTTVPERLWRTLVADRGPNNTNPPSWYHRACLHCLEHTSSLSGGYINTGALLNLPKCSHIVADFLRRVQSVIWNRKFFISEKLSGAENRSSTAASGSEELDLFGLAPGGAKMNDLLCLLYECSVPVVLREHKSAEDHYYEVIGESFVYGMMDGEARDGLSDAEVTEKTVSFKLR